MKIALFDDYKLGILKGDTIIDVSSVVKDIPHLGPQDLMVGLISRFGEYKKRLEDAAASGKGVPASSVKFRAPVPKPDDAQRAVRAAVRMRGALVTLNERLATRGIAPLRTGIGLHTGEVIAGNIGSEARMEYTVIGDAVNLASRLESATKELGVDVLISEDTAALLGPEFALRYIDEITVKGRKQAVKVFEVTAKG